MKTPKYKHLRFEDRCVIQEFLNHGRSFSAIASRIAKDRTTIAKEVKKHRFMKQVSRTKGLTCPATERAPFVCNACEKAPLCKLTQYRYDASIAENEYQRTLRQERSRLHITSEEIAAINEVVAPLMIHRHHSVNHVFASHPDLLPFSKATFYRYVDAGILNVRNIDLRRRVKFRIKKEYDHTRTKVDTSIKLGRFYSDFKDYMELHPMASVVEMDTVIGTSGGKGGKCFLTLLFRAYNLMLIYLLPYKQAKYVTKVFLDLKDQLGDAEFSRLFEVILTDNGSEFTDPESIEFSLKTGEKLSSVFYCDPNASWQKGCIEKNHTYIRYILPKGTSFSGLSQEDVWLLASHINSVPREILNGLSPYEAAFGFVGKHTMDVFHIQNIPLDEIDLSIRLLKK